MLVEAAYLELASPTIPEGVRRCVDQGAWRVALFPYFLSAGVHVTEDLDALRAHFRQEYPEVEFVLCPPLGLHPAMVEIVCDRLREGLAATGTPPQSA
jgi:sirohydrochlorin ferrochelatase